MKKIQYLLSCCIAVSFIAVSCQKAYERPDITPGTATPPPAGGGGTGSGGLLTKLALTGTGATSSVYTYGYNSSSQLTMLDWNTTQGAQSIIYNWTFTRDNAGKFLQVLEKVNIAQFPSGGVLYIAHYPTAGSTNFDYLMASYLLNGQPVKDSTVYTVVNGQVTQHIQYLDYVNSGYQLSAKVTYAYDNSGNIITVNTYSNNTGTLKLIESIAYEYDAKTNPLQLGQEAFFIEGERYFSKNNFTKSVTTDYSTSSTGVQSTVLFTIQYNSANKPASTIASDPTNANTPVTLTYTYQ